MQDVGGIFAASIIFITMVDQDVRDFLKEILIFRQNTVYLFNGVSFELHTPRPTFLQFIEYSQIV